MSASTSTPTHSNRRTRLNSAFKHLMSLHWAMLHCYILLFFTGPLMTHLPRELWGRGSMYDFHKGVGVLTVILLSWRILTLLRVWWKKYTRRWPKQTPQWWRTVVFHSSLYVFMWAVPLSGFMLSNGYKSNNVRFLGVVLPDIFPEDPALRDLGGTLHFWLGYLFLAFVVLHGIDQWKVVKAFWRRLKQSFSGGSRGSSPQA